MLWAGTRKEQKTQQTQAETAQQEKSITIIPLAPEEPEQCEDKRVLHPKATLPRDTLEKKRLPVEINGFSSRSACAHTQTAKSQNRLIGSSPS
jgi:hypothetical protein